MLHGLPQHFRHIDWATWGLAWLSRIADPDAVDREHIEKVFARTSAYVITRDPCLNCIRPIHVELAEIPLNTAHVWRLHKQLSAGLRYAYLLGLDVLTVMTDSWSDSDETRDRLAFALSDGSQFALEEISHAGLCQSCNVVLQGGNPSMWYCPMAWNAIQPLLPEVGPLLDYPLSRPSYCAPVYDDLLTRLGAVRQGKARWSPPPGNTTMDMHDFLAHHPSARVATEA